MIKKVNALIFFVCLILSCSETAIAQLGLDPEYRYIKVGLEYDDNVTREKLDKDHQQGMIWRLNAAVGIRNIIPIDRLNTRLAYILGMRDVNNTNQEDFNSHDIKFGSSAKITQSTRISFEEAFRKWNSQNDLFNFINNVADAKIDQEIGKRTTAYISYRTEQKWFQNNAPEIQARNYLYHQFRMGINHSISEDFTVQLGYADQLRMYNRRPIDYRKGRPIALKGIQKDRQKVIILGFYAVVFNNTSLALSDQIVNSDSNSRGFSFDGNKTQVFLSSNPVQKLWLDFTYQLAAYTVGAYQTPDLGYELSETRTEDQSFIRFGLTYDVSDQVSLKFNYERVKNTIFFTRDFYNSNIANVGMNVKF